MTLLTNLIFEPKGKHDPALAYAIKDTVMSADGSRVYFALKDVPAGVALSNDDYWKLQIDLSGSKNAMDAALASFGNYAKAIGTRVKGETAKAIGNPVTFLPDADSLLQPVTVLEPQRKGSGDPSPDNVRPFIGYGKLDLNRAGKNLVGGWVQGAVNSKGEEFSSNTVIRSAIVKVSEKNVYVTVPDGLGYFLVEYTDDAFVSRTDRSASQAFTLKDNTTRIRLCLAKSDSSNITPDDAVGYQVEYGSVGTSVVLYQNKLHTVQIDQIVYGFRYEWLTGKGLIEWMMETYNGTETWEQFGSVIITSYSAADKPPAANMLGETLCSHYLYNSSGGTNTCDIFIQDNGNWMTRFRPGMDVAAWKNHLAAQYAAGTPVQIAYKLATPIEIQPLAPAIISAADSEQTNTLYGDGSIEVEYVKPLHVSIEERVAAAVAAAMQTQ